MRRLAALPTTPQPDYAAGHRRGWLIVLVVLIAALHWAVLEAPWPVAERPPSPAAPATVFVTTQAAQAQPARPDSAATATRPPTVPRAASAAPAVDNQALTAVAQAPREGQIAAQAPAPGTVDARSLPAPATTLSPTGPDPPPTQIPAPQVWTFVAEQGAQRGAATLRWSHDGEQYVLTLDASDWLAMRSQGSFDAWGLAPTRFTERRRPRSERALTMERPPDAPGQVAYSARSEPGPLAPGLQDRLSWLLQAQALVAAHLPPPGQHLSLQIASPGGDQQPWRLERLPPEPEDDGVIKFRHEPLRPYDNRVELWLETAPPHAPRRLWLASARGEPLLLTRMPERAEPASTSGSQAPK